jgi:S1-C subfamily serine protease
MGVSHIYIDRSNDIALLDLNERDKGLLKCPKTPEIGQSVIAIGSPFGLEHTLTQGIVSGLHRDLGELENAFLTDLIQSDTPINPGNSGGPLLDARKGCLIGMNTAIISPTGVNSGIALAIPIDDIDTFIDRYEQKDE